MSREPSHAIPPPEGSVELAWGRERLVLLAERALHVPDHHTLVLADLHLGKSGHLRRSGIPIPAGAQRTTLERLSALLERLRPRRVLVLGDLFHSRLNPEWEAFVQWRERRPDPAEEHWVLVRGNHDILPLAAYREARLEVVPEWTLGEIRMVHEPGDDPGGNSGRDRGPSSTSPSGASPSSSSPSSTSPSGASPSGALPTLCGHIHPGVRIALGGRSRVVLPCFHLSAQRLILPAFGDLTGLHTLPVGPGEQAFATLEGRIVSVQRGNRLR